jgi:hypothetical protein
MDEITVIQNADFLSIALEQFDSGNHEVAEGFISDVRASLLNDAEGELSQKLDEALVHIEEERYDEAEEIVGDVYEVFVDLL